VSVFDSVAASDSFLPQAIFRIAKVITSRLLIVEVKNVLKGLEYFIFLCEDAELDCREILQSEKDFITKRTRLIPSCVLEVIFVSQETLGEGQG
jgi:hypothetical protein